MSKISQKLDLRHAQQLVMTPQLQQAIKLLQLNNLELSEFIEGELAENPFLEREESADIESSDDPSSPSEPEEESGQEEFSDFDPGTSQAGAGGNTKFGEFDENLENRMPLEKTLRDHLTEQIFVALGDPRDRMLGSLLIDHLDEAGYLRENPLDLAEQLGSKPERIENLLKVLKTFDPAGVFAADLRECLALQLADRGQLDAPMKTLLENLNLIADRDYRKLAALCGVNETYVKDMIKEIQALNPKPAGDYEHLVVQTAVPDVLMKRLPKTVGGGWRVELNSETLPRVLINQQYYTEVSGLAAQKKDKEYLARQLHSANWLVKAIDQRARTILKVASEIVEQQDAFFNYGIEFLKPLTLKDVAEAIQMHESTVSRVTTNKYIGTPRGIFELKFFFSTALGGTESPAHSSEAVKARIRTLIDNEEPGNILSDDTIVSLLKDEGIDIARRTVAKYRELLRIGSSVQRRKLKKDR